MIKFFVLFLLVGCATVPPCYNMSDIVERTRCYENEKQQRFFNEVGWRYHEHRLERISE